MSEQCENCGQMVLNTDLTCWHCGWKLAAGDNISPADTTNVTTAASTTFPFTLIAAYGGLTIVIFIAMLWMMGFLGRQPSNLPDSDLSLAPGWRLVISQDRTFALHLPPDWVLLEEGGNDAGADTISLGPNAGRTGTLLQPFQDAGYRLEWLAEAGAEDEGCQPGLTCVLITCETGFNRISTEAAIEVLQQREFVFLRAILSTDSSGQESSELQFEMDDDGLSYRCQAKLTLGADDTFLLSACAPRTLFPAQARMLQAIIASFQPFSD